MSLAKPYEVDDDSGDDLFNESNTLERIPLPKPARQYVTQPTQLLPSSPQTQRSSPSIVQVAASSPSQTFVPKPAPLNRGALNGGLLAYSMAPPGTAYRPPVYIPRNAPKQPSQQSQHVTSQQLEMSDDEPRAISESSDDELLPSAHITPSVFQKTKPVVTSQPSRENSFKTLAAGFTYEGSLAANKRSSDAMADAHGNSGRLAKMARQTGPSRAQPVPIVRTLDDVPDYQTRQKIKDMLVVFPTQSISACEQALREARGNQSDALSNLVAGGGSKGSRAIDLTASDDEFPELQSLVTKAFNKPAAKRQVDVPARSIQEKYSSLQTAARVPVKPVVSSPVREKRETLESTGEAPRRRRLVQGRRAPTSPMAPSSPNVVSVQTTRPKVVQVIESDDDGEDSGVGEEDELDPERQNTLLKFINTCTAAGLVDLSSQPIENVECVLGKRPFKSLNDVRAVSIETKSITKTGRGRTGKKLVGDRLVDACEDMWLGYEAVDELVAECAALGKPIAEEMRKWGINVHGQSGELEMVELDGISAHDSGIGTPTSTAASVDDDDGLSVSRPKKKSTLLRQPQIMSPGLTMKDYQVAGLNWLALLYSRKLSCILADDMVSAAEIPILLSVKREKR